MKNNPKVDAIKVTFIQDVKTSGWIQIHLSAGSIHEKIMASIAFPPFEDLISFLEDILLSKFPSSFVLDEEGVLKKFNAIEHSDPEFFSFVLGFPAHVFIEGVFNKKQFVTEIYEKFSMFLMDGYIKKGWINRNEKEDLKKIELDRLKNLLGN